MVKVYKRTLTVPRDALDELGHVNNVRYVAWLQEVARAHSEANGWPLVRYLESGGAYVVRTLTITYERPAFAGDEITIYTWLAGYRQITAVRRSLFIRRPGGEALARAESVWAYTDLQTGRPRRVPPELREAFAVVGEEAEALRLAGA